MVLSRKQINAVAATTEAGMTTFIGCYFVQLEAKPSVVYTTA